MSKPIVLTTSTWEKLYEKIKLDYPRSVWLIRDRMKDKLGFTVREHVELPKEGQHWNYNKCVSIRLDFYDEMKRTMFLLKYSEFIKIHEHTA